jgi:matrixin
MKIRILYTIIIFSISAMIYAYSILSNSSGYPRTYADIDIPFIYELNDTTPPDYLTSIITGAETWDNVPSAYWEFEYGGLTSVNSDGQDNTNLVFFDFQGVNFSPGTNTIAYSRTWTSGSGANYHAIESDLVWNARDYPPSPVGAFGQQDLQSVITHEFGHHLGLGHAGPIGGPPGVGPLILAATMYGTSSSGDTTKRSLHIDDIAGVSQIYPSWIIEGTVYNATSGQPMEDAKIYSDDVFGSLTGPLEYDPTSGRYQKPGYYVDSIFTDINGIYSVIALNQTFNLSATYYGFGTQTFPISFNAPAGIGQTQTETQDYYISESSISSISGTVIDSISGIPVMSNIKIYVTSDKPGTPVGPVIDTTTTANGQFNVSLPSSENYSVVAHPVSPYAEKIYMVEDLDISGEVLSFSVIPAQILLVDDDAGMEYEKYYKECLENMNTTYHYWNVENNGAPNQQVRDGFASKTLIWFTGDSSNSPLTTTEHDELLDHITNGGKLFLTGQDIAEMNSGSQLFSTIGVDFVSNWTLSLVLGISGDLVSNGLVFNTMGFGGADNQTSRDVLAITDTIHTNKIFLYGTGTSNPAGVRYANDLANSKVVFLGFGFESINDASRCHTLMTKVLDYLNNPVTGVEEINAGNVVPRKFALNQNYPNPFNPTTTIVFDVASKTRIKIFLYNSLGQRIAELFDKEMNAGTYKMNWNALDSKGGRLSSGVYYYQMITSSGYSNTKKLLLLK